MGYHSESEDEDISCSHWLHDHLCGLDDAVVWLHDHIDAREIVGACVVIALVVLGYIHQDMCIAAWHTCTGYFMQLGPFAMVPIILMCITATVLGIPVDFILLWSGVFFESAYGPVAGVALGVTAGCVGVYCGCIAAFLLGRAFLKPKVEEYMQTYEMLQAINAIIETDGWKFAFIMRLSPLIPNEPLNYACSATSMNLRQMAISTIGSLPKTAYEIWLAAQAADSLSSDSKKSSMSWYFIVIANASILILMIVLCIVAKRKFDQQVARSKAITKDQKLVMRRRATLRGFEAEARRKSRRAAMSKAHTERLLGA